MMFFQFRHLYNEFLLYRRRFFVRKLSSAKRRRSILKGYKITIPYSMMLS